MTYIPYETCSSVKNQPKVLKNWRIYVVLNSIQNGRKKRELRQGNPALREVLYVERASNVMGTLIHARLYLNMSSLRPSYKY